MSFKLLMRIMRAPFFSASVAPVILGNLIAFWETGTLNPLVFVLSVVAMLFVHASANTANDYFDSRSGNDEANQQAGPFNGGSRVIQEGLASRRTVGLISLVSAIIALGIGVVLWLITPGNWILWLGLFGIASGVFYSAPPLKLSYRGLGELSIMVNVAFLPILGGYYAQTGMFSMPALYAGIASALLILGVIWINEFPDRDADVKVKRRNLVNMLGIKRARVAFAVMIVAAFAVSLVLAILGILPWWTLLIFLTLPLAIGAIRGSWKNYDKPKALIPAQGQTIQLQLFGNLTLAIGFLVAGIIG